MAVIISDVIELEIYRNMDCSGIEPSEIRQTAASIVKRLQEEGLLADLTEPKPETGE